MCIVCTVVCSKVPVELKHHLAVKISSPGNMWLLNYTCLKELES